MSTSPTSWTKRRARIQADPEAARLYAAERARIAAIDDLVNSIASEIEQLGVSKADVARAVGADASVLRRLLTTSRRNPTVGTVGEIAASLGMRLTLVPLTEAERAEYEPILIEGVADRQAANH